MRLLVIISALLVNCACVAGIHRVALIHGENVTNSKEEVIVSEAGEVLRRTSEMEIVEAVDTTASNNSSPSRGIVFSCPNARSTESRGSWKPSVLWNGFATSARLVRNLGSKIPIYNMVHPSELEATSTLCNKLNDIVGDVHCMPVSKMGASGYGYSKVYAVRDAPVDQVLFVDCDAFLLKDPTYLFEDDAFINQGALFWGDVEGHFASEGRLEQVKKLLPAGRLSSLGTWWGMQGFDSGLLLIDKVKSEKPLRTLYRIIGSDPESPRLPRDMLNAISMGDKDLWHYAWLADGPECTDAACHLNPYIGVTGSCDKYGSFRMSSQAKMDSRGDILALHQIQRYMDAYNDNVVTVSSILTIDIRGRSKPVPKPFHRFTHPNDLYYGFHSGGHMRCKTLEEEFPGQTKPAPSELQKMIELVSACWRGHDCTLF